MTTVIVEKRGYESPAFWRSAAKTGRRALEAAQEARILKRRAGEALETRLYDAAHGIRKHPFMAVATAFAIGVPVGVLACLASTRRR